MSKVSLTTGIAIFPACLGRRSNTLSAIRVPKGFDSLDVVKTAYLHRLSLGVGLSKVGGRFSASAIPAT